MSQDSVTQRLSALMRREMFEIPPGEHISHLNAESDRAFIILKGAFLERFLTSELRAKFVGLNADEAARIFSFEGPCGSFSSKIQMAQALNIVDRKFRKKLDVIRSLRNVAAHSHPSLSFETDEVREAVWHLLEVPTQKSGGAVTRALFTTVCISLMTAITGEPDRARLAFDVMREDLLKSGRSEPAPRKRKPRSRRDHPRTG